jgi:hypothetical protein
MEIYGIGDDAMKTKLCSRCGEHLALTMFYRSKRTKDGYTVYCKRCYAERSGRKFTPKEQWPDGYRACTKCEEIKPLEEFHKTKKGRFGHTSVCKVCRSRAKPKPQAREGHLICFKCGEEKPATPEYFRRYSRAENGLMSMCRACTRQAAKERYYQLIEEDPDHNKKRYQKYRINRQKRAKIYYRVNRKKRIDYSRQWYWENLERARHRGRRYYQEHQEEMIEKSRQWRQDNPERYREYNRQWAEDNPDTYEIMMQAAWVRRRARKQNLPDDFTTEDWAYCLEYWDNKCAVCGEDEKLHADHWIPLSNEDCPGTTADNMIVLCDHCNRTKHARDAELWLTEKFGEELAIEYLAKIEAYFDHIRQRKSDE